MKIELLIILDVNGDFIIFYISFFFIIILQGLIIEILDRYM